MKHPAVLLLFYTAALSLTFAIPRKAQQDSKTDSTGTRRIVRIEGLVRDIACPIQNRQATATQFNLQCAQECARNGSPLIILTSKGLIYIPISVSMPDEDQRKRLMPYLGKYVRVSGLVYERAGTRAIQIKTITELKSVPLVKNAQ